MVCLIERRVTAMDDAFREGVRRLAASAGLEGEFRVEAIPGGANNRAYRLSHPRGDFFLKSYFHDPSDTRDRIGAEFSFATFVWNRGLRCIAVPIARRDEERLALFEFVNGRQPTQEEVTSRVVKIAVSFFRDVNGFRDHSEADCLPTASEAYFSLGGHINGVDRRVQRLLRIETATEIGRETAAFVVGELTPAWARVKDNVLREIDSRGWELTHELDRQSRCLSPSDFGFHNCLVRESGELCFHDFEYAGWDDPVKMACDFFSQPQRPVPMAYWESFTKEVSVGFPDPLRLRETMALMLPVYRIKFCCIMLNEFLPEGLTRRRFARSTMDVDRRKQEQIAKARSALRNVSKRT